MLKYMMSFQWSFGGKKSMWLTYTWGFCNVPDEMYAEITFHCAVHSVPIANGSIGQWWPSSKRLPTARPSSARFFKSFFNSFVNVVLDARGILLYMIARTKFFASAGILSEAMVPLSNVPTPGGTCGCTPCWEQKTNQFYTMLASIHVVTSIQVSRDTNI